MEGIPGTTECSVSDNYTEVMMNDSLREAKAKLKTIKGVVGDMPGFSTWNSQAPPSCFGHDECFHGIEVYSYLEVETHILSNKSLTDITSRLLETYRKHRDRMNDMIARMEAYIE